MNPRAGFALWARWVLANSLGELLGLGATFAIGIGLFSGLAEAPGLLPTIATALLMTASGALEGSIVGWAQWRVLRTPFLQLGRRAWILATIGGALLAWFLGSIPMTIASLSAGAGQTAGQEPPAAVMVLMEVGMGLAAGLILSIVQGRVLRGVSSPAWIWLPANAVAWAIGMPIIFAAIDLAQKAGSTLGAVVTVAVALAVTGAIVGAIHGIALLALARKNASFSTT
jgi:hypothetical protein